MDCENCYKYKRCWSCTEWLKTCDLKDQVEGCFNCDMKDCPMVVEDCESCKLPTA